jgi:hypothetical protein
MASPPSWVITATWLALNLLPLVIAPLLWLVLGYRLAGLLLAVLYPVYFVPYGFFVALPLMLRLFRHPASLHRP